MENQRSDQIFTFSWTWPIHASRNGVHEGILTKERNLKAGIDTSEIIDTYDFSLEYIREG